MTELKYEVDVVLPVRDEVAAIPWVLSRMPAGHRPLVVDNGSTDGSGDRARSLGATVVEARVPGFGAACWAGLVAAGADVVAFMDCDGSLDPTELPLVTARLCDGSADLVLGARRLTTRTAMPSHARVANRWLARAVRRRTGAPVTDLGPMRAARRAALLDLDLRDRRSGWPLEMVLAASRAGWRIEEVDVSYGPRSGRSKITGTWRGTAHAIADMRRQLNVHRRLPA